MTILNKKSYELSLDYFKALPLNIRIILSNPQAPGNMRDGATKIIKETGLNEMARIALHIVIYGLFTKELPNLESLSQAIQEELETTPEKALEIEAIIKQFFIEPHKIFFERIYETTNSGIKMNKEEDKGNIVNLKQKNNEQGVINNGKI